MLAISSLLLHTGVEGETPDGPPGHIEIESFSFGTAKSGATGSGAPGQNTGAGSATVLDFIKAPTNHELSGYMTYKLENVFVTSYQIGGGNSGSTVPTESFSLNFANIHIPRVGQEVIVDYLEGDPDRPIIVRSLGDTTPGCSQPNGGLTNAGGGYNQLLMNDVGGAERIYVHAGNDQGIDVEHDETHWVGHDRTVTVEHDETIIIKHDRTQTVDTNETITIHGNRTETVDKNETITVSPLRTHAIGINEAITVGAAQEITVGALRTITVGAALTIQAGEEIMLKTEDAGIVMTKDGTITIKGKDITIKGSAIVAAGDLNGDGKVDIITGVGTGNGAFIHFLLPYIEQDPVYRTSDSPIFKLQFAVNIVDFIDEDDISTPFNFHGLVVGIGTDQLNTSLPNNFVFGTELPPLILNELLVQGNDRLIAPGTGIAPEELQRIPLGFDPFEILRDFNAAAFVTSPLGDDALLLTRVEVVPWVGFLTVQANAAGPLFCVQYRETAFNFVSSQEYFTFLIGSLEHYDYPGSYALQPANQPPVVSAGDDATLIEGQTFSRAATFTDDYSDAGPWTATVDYGDGSGEQPLVLNADKSFSLNHTYTDDGTYTATVRVTDEQGAVGTDTLIVTAQNALPRFTAAAIAPVHERQLATLQAAVDDSNPFDPLTVTIDWGDGSAPQVLALPPGTRTIHPTHRYAHDGQFTVKLSVSDDDGSLATARVQANVQNVDIIAVGVDSGSAPLVRAFDSNTHALKFNITPYESNFRGGVRVATGDVNGDGVPDIVTAPGAGRQAQIKVFDGASGQLLAGPVGAFLGFEKTFLGGVYVAAGDVNGDGLADIIVGRGSGKSEVRVFSGASGSQLSSFFAYAPNFGGGVYVAAGDVNGDGFADIITGPGAGNSAPQVKVFNGLTDSLIASFLAYSPSFHGGVFVAAGDVDGDGRAEIVTGAGPGGAPQVKVFSAATLKAIDSFFAYDPSFHGGVRVAVGDVNGDGRADIITGAGNGAAQKVRAFDGLSLAVLDSFFALDPKAGKGLFVAGSR